MHSSCTPARGGIKQELLNRLDLSYRISFCLSSRSRSRLSFRFHWSFHFRFR